LKELEGNIKICLRKIGCGNVNWMELAKDYIIGELSNY
jgi:hypothetical protein